MTRDELRKVVIDSLVSVAPEADPAALSPGESLRESLDLDSMDFLRFVRALDAALGVEVPEADYGKLDSMDGAVAYLAARKGL